MSSFLYAGCPRSNTRIHARSNAAEIDCKVCMRVLGPIKGHGQVGDLPNALTHAFMHVQTHRTLSIGLHFECAVNACVCECNSLLAAQSHRKQTASYSGCLLCVCVKTSVRSVIDGTIVQAYTYARTRTSQPRPFQRHTCKLHIKSRPL